MKKLYVITRRDLSDGAQLAQSCHAAIRFSLNHFAATDEWHHASNNIAVLAAKDELELEKLYTLAEEAGCKITRFEEPDYDDALTSIAIMGEDAHKFLSQLPLALRERLEYDADCYTMRGGKSKVA